MAQALKMCFGTSLKVNTSCRHFNHCWAHTTLPEGNVHLKTVLPDPRLLSHQWGAGCVREAYKGEPPPAAPAPHGYPTARFHTVPYRLQGHQQWHMVKCWQIHRNTKRDTFIIGCPVCNCLQICPNFQWTVISR